MSEIEKKQINNSKYIKEIHKTLIDNQGRRKYFRELNPVLQDEPIQINPNSIKNKKKILFVLPNFRWIDEDVNATWDLIPWNLCQIAAVVEDIVDDIKILDAHKKNLSLDNIFN